ncbi:putative UPF0481 protein At3g02645 [Pistacia vera]|uniref:putative UPF0481 protein At3g02645 n=1 Tax=Pistacia vera TaxID=55513 RepID=UPI0012635EB0|nr:putative UPF0481 protein At3g02645 [Pistacia vera]
MVLYDAIFIIELFLKDWEDKNDCLLDKPRLRFGLELDLQLPENQLPYFILEKFYSLAKSERENYPDDFIGLPRKFYDSLSNEELSYQAEVKHFTDLRRNDLSQNLLEEYGPHLSGSPSAVKLNESGVKLKGIKGGCLLNIVREKRNFKIPIPYFSGVELKIPHMEIEDGTETVTRNVMAFEQCHYPSNPHICNYIKFMDDLIDTEKDIDLLIEKGILLNSLGDNATIVRMFNRFGLNITLSKSCYSGIVKDLNEHYNNGWNHARATLKRVYFSNPWKGTGTIAAIILYYLHPYKPFVPLSKFCGFSNC